MSRDHSLALQTAVIAALIADAAVAALVAGRVYDHVPADPVWPFIRYGADLVVPFEATTIDGGEIDITLHAFARGFGRGEVKQILRAVQAALHEAPLGLADGYLLYLTHIRSRILEDQTEQSAWHGTVEFKAVTGAV